MPFIQVNGPQLVFSDSNRILAEIVLNLFYIFASHLTEYNILQLIRVDIQENSVINYKKKILALSKCLLVLLNIEPKCKIVLGKP